MEHAIDVFHAHGADKDHPGRYGMWRLKEYRKGNARDNPEFLAWGGRTPKYVQLFENMDRPWQPPFTTGIGGLVNWLVYPCCVNSSGLVNVYPPDGSPPIPVPLTNLKVIDYWEDDE